MGSATIRRSVFNGSFYPRTASEIKKMLDALRMRAEESGRQLHPPILIIPHAGWIFSGLAAVKGVSTLRAHPPKRIVLIGPSHRHYFLGFSIADYEKYETPLGTLEVDRSLGQELCDTTGFGFEPEADNYEHSLEVILPMIQHLLPAGTKILPILAGSVSRADSLKLADALAGLLDPLQDALIVSTDLSHFFQYEEARKLDNATLELIIAGNDSEIIRRSGEGGRLCCGYNGVVTAMALGKKWSLGDPEVLIYYNSGDTGGERDSVVGYASIAWPAPKFEMEESS